VHRKELKASWPLGELGLAWPRRLQDTIASEDELPLQQKIPKILFRFCASNIMIMIVAGTAPGTVRHGRGRRPEVCVGL
jgi:hypothetical protein